MIDFKKIVFIFSFILYSVAFGQTVHNYSVNFQSKKLPFGLTENIPTKMPQVALALSGGGARGLSQIGVLQALKDAGIKYNIIVGTSMGSIIGGLYASGYSPEEMDSIARETDWEAILASDRETNRRELFVDQKVTEDKAVFSLRLNGLKPIIPTSINNGQKLSNYLNLLTFKAPIHVIKYFSGLRVNYRAVCTNLVTGEPYVIDHGSLSHAMRASSSVSFLLSPVKIDSVTLVDGGLVANIPVDQAKNIGANYVIAVNSTSDLHTENDLTFPWQVADQVVSIPMKKLNESQLKNANIIITPDLDDYPADNFDSVESLIKKGYSATMPVLKKIKNGIDSTLIKKLDVEKFYIHNVLINSGVKDFELPYLQKYSLQDSVSNIEILEDLYSIASSGIYKNLSVSIKSFDNYSSVRFFAQTNKIIKRIIVNNVSLLKKTEIDSVLYPLKNKPYDGEKTLRYLLKVINIYRDYGYNLSDIESTKFDTTTGALSIYISEGKINNVIIKGNTYTNPTIITRELPFQKGGYFKYDEAQQALVNLRSTNLFDDIYLNIESENHQNNVIVHVSEKTSSLLRLGFRVDNEDKAQFSFDIRDENLLGSGTELGILLFGGVRNRAYILEHKSNRIFDTYLTYKINGFYKFNSVYAYRDVTTNNTKRFTREEYGEYRQIYYGGSIAVGMQVKRFGNVIFQGKYQVDKVKNLNNQPIDPYSLSIFSLSGSSTIDTQNKYPYPTKGIYLKASYETAQSVLGGDIGYTKVSFDYKNYFTISGAHTISPRLMLGFADKTLPISEAFSLGGQNSFFGMRDNEFRGRQIFLASLEYRYKLPFEIFFDTYLKLRYDVGFAWPEQEEIRFKDLRHGIGTSISFDTPIGPADFSVGRSFLFVKNLPGNPISLGDIFFYFSIGYYY